MKVTLKREQLFNLSIALQVTKRLRVTPHFRYQTVKNLQAIEPELKATQEAFPEPDLRAALKALSEAKGTDKEAEAQTALADVEAKHKEWETSIKSHLESSIELDLIPMSFPDDLDDLAVEDTTGRNLQAQALIEALMPVLKEPGK